MNRLRSRYGQQLHTFPGTLTQYLYLYTACHRSIKRMPAGRLPTRSTGER